MGRGGGHNISRLDSNLLSCLYRNQEALDQDDQK